MVRVWLENVVDGLKALLIGEMFQEPKANFATDSTTAMLCNFYISCQLGNNWYCGPSLESIPMDICEPQIPGRGTTVEWKTPV